MKLALAILATLLWLTDNHREPREERNVRLWPIAVALSEEGRNVTEISRVLSQGRAESRFTRNVQFGECRPGTCDPNSHGIPRAHGPYQAHAIRSRPDLLELWERARTDAYAATILELKMQRELFSCGGNVVHSFSAHDGKGCRDTERGRFRAGVARRIEARIRKELSK